MLDSGPICRTPNRPRALSLSRTAVGVALARRDNPQRRIRQDISRHGGKSRDVLSPPKTDVRQHIVHVCFVPIADFAHSPQESLSTPATPRLWPLARYITRF